MKLVLLIVAGVFAAAPLAAETLAEAGGLVVADGKARAAGPLARTGAGYFTVTNTGSAPDRLLAVETRAAQRVELHATAVENGVARMTPLLDGMPLPAGETVAFAQGGMHLMFLGLTEPWDTQAGVPLTLLFERAGPVEIVLPVAAGPAEEAGGAHAGH